MLNKYPLWKNLMIVFVIALSLVYAAPNFYPPDPAIQISHESGLVDQSAMDTASASLLADGINFVSAELEDGSGLIRLLDQNDQRRAQEIVQLSLPSDYLVAQNMAPNTPEFLRSFGAGPMAYGLDLSGGVHFLMEVDMEQAVSNQLNDSIAVMRRLLREERLRYRPPIEVDATNRIVIRFNDTETRSTANRLIREEFPDLISRNTEIGNEFVLYYQPTEASILLLQDYALQQNLSTLRTRVDALGVREPKVQRMGADRIVVELPGIQDTARAKDIISTVATLRFHLVAETTAAPGTTTDFDYQGAPITLENDLIVGGDSVTQAQASFDAQTSMPQVNITLDAAGARQMNEATRSNIGRNMAILLSETKVRTVTKLLPNGEIESSSEPYEEVRVISAPTIQAALGRQFRITGLAGNEANDLALLIRSGALAAPMYFLEESTIGPSLGQENIDRGVLSVAIGFTLVLVFMAAYYRLFGLVANIALTINLFLLVAVMSIIGATLTLPGIAGVVLTVGMAVDANVLIFARIREELRNGLSIQKAIDSGYGRAFVTILDANVTTLLVAIILYSIGTGPVKGFAVTLSIGILTSMFTAVVVTRSIINLIYGGRKVNKLSIGIKMPEPSVDKG
ncbi:protein translocase subunit SecD [Haliea sp. AH-315-K21]|uniref:Protein translocase subunit SecD n=1 Tax=SAR86 cluster bacterium TaxID=2030880 RepID=A0A2A5CCB9_9GAMM|nr:protein translocase subunit SecD [Haliea sp. AH-315-K21]PCJ41175.1 MAG: protein translocase subunit SecD [SAR86 cluster bacterium]